MLMIIGFMLLYDRYIYIYEIWYMRIDIYKRFHNWSQKCDFTKDSSMIKSVTALLLESDVFRVRV